MNALLLTLTAMGCLNTLCMLWHLVSGDQPEVTPLIRFLDATYTFSIGAWAFWLLAKGSA